MNSQNANHSLIEYVLALLSIPEIGNAGVEELASFLPNSKDAHMAYEMIKFMDEMPGGFLIYHADSDGKIIYANKAVFHIFQCSTLKEFKDLTGNSFKGMIHPEDWASVEQSIREQISHNQFDLDYVEYRIIRKDGAVRWIEDYGHFVYNNLIGNIFYVFLTDATEKRSRQLSEKMVLLNEKMQSEQKMQQLIRQYHKEKNLISQEHLRRLEVIEGLSVNYESILYANLDTDEILPYRLSCRTRQQFERKFQVRPFSWYVTNYVYTWVHPEDKDFVAASTAPSHIRERLSEHKTYYINYRALYKGETHFLQLRIVSVGRRKCVSQIVLGYRRVDKEIRLEMEQKQMLQSALNNANLAIVAKNAFLSNMSHDMRTPLNAIFGFTALAKKNSQDNQTVQSYLDKIETASNQLLELIDKVLKLSWSESNDSQMAASPCSLPGILDDIYGLISPRAAKKNIVFLLDSKLEHEDVYADPDKLKQLLLYLADNAVIYTKNGGHIHMSVAEKEQRANGSIAYEFVIKDTGIGISTDFLPHIFEPFCREQNTTSSGIHGTGLGLTIAKDLADKMGGTIEVSSIPQEGSTFTVTLPFSVQEHLPIKKDTVFKIVPQKILLVEDNEINLEIAMEILKDQGFSIDTATDGSIAVEKVKQSKPGDYSLILMDIQMPVMDGWQATRTIRKLENPALARIPIVALSANAFDSDKQTSIESGMEAHLTKPIDVPLLMDTITKIMQVNKS